MKAARLVLGLGSVALMSAPAMANGTFYREGLDMFGVGYTPGETVEIGYSQNRAVAIRAGQCGEVIVRNAVTDIKVDGTVVNVAALPVQLLPPCTNGQFDEARPANFKTPDNRAVIVGKTPGTFSTVFTDGVRRVRANGCGLIEARANNTYQHDAAVAITIPGVSAATIGDLPQKGRPICRTDSQTQQSRTYYPADWLTTP